MLYKVRINELFKTFPAGYYRFLGNYKECGETGKSQSGKSHWRTSIGTTALAHICIRMYNILLLNSCFSLLLDMPSSNFQKFKFRVSRLILCYFRSANYMTVILCMYVIIFI